MSKFQSKIIKDFEAQGYCVIKLSKTNKNGIADLLVAKDGCRTKLVEVKEKTDTIKPLQIFQNLEICKVTGFEFLIMQDGYLGNFDYELSKYKNELFYYEKI